MTKPTEPTKAEIDFKLCTIRRDCLNMAVEANKNNPRDIIDFAAQMYQFIITGDKEVSEDIQPQKEWK